MIGGSRSLTSIFTAVALPAALGTALVLLLLLSVRNGQLIDRIETRALQARAQMIAQHLRRDSAGDWVLELPADVAAAFSIVYGRAAYAVLDDNGRLLLGAGTSSPLAPLTSPPWPAAFSVARGDQVFTGVSLTTEVEGARLTIQVAEDQDHPDVLLDDLRSGFPITVAWAVLVPVLAVLTALELLLLHRLVRPIKSLAQRAELISPDRRAEPLPEDGIPSEILPLVRSMNAALSRVEAARAAQRQFTAEAAHEFRTPLAVLRARIDVLGDARMAAILGSDLAALDRLITQLLIIAEVDDPGAHPDTVLNLSRVVQDVSGFVAGLGAARRVGLRLDLPTDPIWVHAHEEALSQAVLNLLENAIGHSPEGATVRATVTPEGELQVADSGPGVPEHERKAIFRRFWRARRRVTSDRRGAGLGLAIVQRAAEMHGGAVDAGDAPEGGALFSFRLPLAAPPRRRSGATATRGRTAEVPHA